VSGLRIAMVRSRLGQMPAGLAWVTFGRVFMSLVLSVLMFRLMFRLILRADALDGEPKPENQKGRRVGEPGGLGRGDLT
jgi:hypothetical protein